MVRGTTGEIPNGTEEVGEEAVYVAGELVFWEWKKETRPIRG
jgi:hypothetical protein